MAEQQIEEKTSLLFREDVRTMAKDLARLREKESLKERERILHLQDKKAQKAQNPTPLPPPLQQPLVSSSIQIKQEGLTKQVFIAPREHPVKREPSVIRPLQAETAQTQPKASPPPVLRPFSPSQSSKKQAPELPAKTKQVFPSELRPPSALEKLGIRAVLILVALFLLANAVALAYYFLTR